MGVKNAEQRDSYLFDQYKWQDSIIYSVDATD